MNQNGTEFSSNFSVQEDVESLAGVVSDKLIAARELQTKSKTVSTRYTVVKSVQDKSPKKERLV